jgi:uncharacterized protein YcgL (UPF0745 family)
MENLFIQSFINTDGDTFLEVGFGDDFITVPTLMSGFGNFNEVKITALNWLKVKQFARVNQNQVAEALAQQFGHCQFNVIL